jgi:hypothetical protein
MPEKYTLTTLADGVYTNTANWVGGVAPVANDDVLFQFGSAQSLTGSDQSGTELDDITILPTCSGDAGSADTYLQLDQGAANSVVYAGGGTWYLDMGTAGSTEVRVDRTRTASQGNAGLYFKNDTNPITTFDVVSGVVRLVNANITTLVVRADATVIIDAACTVGTIQIEGGTLEDLGAAVTTINQSGGVVTQKGADAYTLNQYGGTFYNDGTGTATVNLYGGIFDSERDGRAKSVTLTQTGGTAKLSANVTLTDTFNTAVTITA